MQVTGVSRIDLIRQEIPILRERFGVRELAVFGSVVRGEQRLDSDVDVLVTFDGPADFDRFMGLKFHLEDLLRSRVDLVTRKALRPELRVRIEKEAVSIA